MVHSPHQDGQEQDIEDPVGNEDADEPHHRLALHSELQLQVLQELHIEGLHRVAVHRLWGRGEWRSGCKSLCEIGAIVLAI